MKNPKIEHAASAVASRQRWWTFGTLCLGLLMITMNATMVYMALPSIRLDLHFSETSLVWVAGAYLCAYGGCLLVGGRLGDCYGHRRVFLLGVLLFTLASLGCGLATSPELLIAARSMQGVAGAIIVPVVFSLISHIFAEVTQRAKALGLCSCVGATGGGIGLILGGALTGALGWRWSFLANVLLGMCIYAICRIHLPRAGVRRQREEIDVAGTATIAASLMIAIYAVVTADRDGWGSSQTWLLLATAALLLIIFVAIEARVNTPLIPLALFRIRAVVIANIAGALMASTTLTWNFFGTLYLQRVLHLSPMQAGSLFLPANLATALVSLAITPRLIVQFGYRGPLVAGMFLIGVGLAVLASAPVGANVPLEVLPGMLLIGIGIGTAYSPMLLSALSDAPASYSGVTSGLINVSLAVGGTFGLSALASIASEQTDDLLRAGTEVAAALTSGYQTAFAGAAMLAVLAGLIGYFALPSRTRLTEPADTCTRRNGSDPASGS